MKELLQRYIKGEVSEKERLKIASWLDESPENMREFLVLRKLYDISLWQANTDKTNSVKKVHYSIRKVMAEILKIAAIFLIGFWGSKQLQIQQSNKKQMQTIHVPAGQRAEVTLADGTHVWLNSRSTLKFPEQFSANTRNVELDIIRKTKCFDFLERNVLFPKTKRSFFRTPKHPYPAPLRLISHFKLFIRNLIISPKITTFV